MYTKNAYRQGRSPAYSRKIGRIMRLTSLILITVCLQLNAMSLAQKVSLSRTGLPLKTVLKELSAQSDYDVVCTDRLFEQAESVYIKVKDVNVDEALRLIFAEQPLSYTILDRTIVIREKTPAITNLTGDLFFDAGTAGEESAPRQTTVTGTVTDTTGSPLPGVAVQLKDTDQGSITDENGRYELEYTGNEAVLVFSMVGFSTQEVAADGRGLIDIILKVEESQLDEVVVVGYGVQKKVNLTGSVSEINAEDIQMRAVNSATQALQGLAPNLNVDANSTGGAADASMNINIRGTGSLSSSVPYILINGVRATQSEFAALNPSTIQSISVLKDAASTAIYGAQAAYGVILVETKSSSAGQDFSLTYSNNFRLKERIFVPPSVNSLQYAEVLNVASRNYSGQVAVNQEQMELIRSYLEGELEYGTAPDPANPNEWLGIQNGTSDGWFTGFSNTDWWDIMYDDLGFTQKHDLSVSGGSEKITYYVSGGLLNDPGQLTYGDANENYDRYNFNSNITANITDWLKITNITRFYQENNTFPATLEGGSRGRLYHDIMRFSPLAPYKVPPVKDEEGNVIVPEQLALLPAFNENNGSNAYNINNLVSTFKADLNLAPGLAVRGDFTFKREFYDRTLNLKKWALTGPQGTPSVMYQANNNQILKDVRKTNYKAFNIYGDYRKSITGSHNFQLLVGYQQEENDYFQLETGRNNVIAPDLNSINVAVGEVIGPSNPLRSWATMGFFGRLTYNFKEKYLFEFNGRYDGSSRFAEGERFGFFPSVSAGYNIDKEPFWGSLRNVVNTMKVRASWGKLGNQDVGRENEYDFNYLYLSSIPIHTQLTWVIDNERPDYTAMPGIVSPAITWETSETRNIGVDLTFLDNRLSASVDVYNRKTNNMFGPSAALPAVLGADPPRTNSASLETKGWELTAGWQDQAGDFAYNLTLLLADNRSFITSYHNPNKVLNDWYIGEEIGEIWGFEVDGLYQTQQEVDDYTSSVDLSYFGTNWQPGNVRYNDMDGNGAVDIGENTAGNPGDRRVIGNSNPRYRYSVQGGLRWKNFDFNMLWQGVGKRDYWMDSYATLFWGWNSRGHTRITQASMDYWSQENPGGYLPLPLEGGGATGFGKDRYPSTRYLQSAAYVRLKSLAIGYTLPAAFAQRLKMKSMRIYLNGENLLTFTGMWENFDPELVTTGSRDRTSVGRAYPLARVYAIGLDIVF